VTTQAVWKAVNEGSIAWVKMFADSTALPLFDRQVLSRLLRAIEYFYNQQSSRPNGIEVPEIGVAQMLDPGDPANIGEGDVTRLESGSGATR